MNITEELLHAFEGFSGAHGQTDVSNQRMNGKQKAKSFIVRQPLTLELMQGHLDGKKVSVLYQSTKRTNVNLVLLILINTH